MKSHNVGKVVDIYKEIIIWILLHFLLLKKINFHFLYKAHQYSKVSAFEIAPEIC